MSMTVPQEYKDLTMAQIEALGLLCPGCLKKNFGDNISSAADHLGGIIEDMFDAGATAVTAAKQQLKPAARGALTRLRDQLNKMLDEQAPQPPE
jgi:hypothetical protein